MEAFPSNRNTLVGEVSPLLVDADSLSESSFAAPGSSGTAVGGQASVWDTILNLMKSCLGTGCLALPFACQQGGILSFLLGAVLIAAWNVYSVQRLCASLEFLEKRNAEQSQTNQRRIPPEGTTTLGSVSWYAFGPIGLHLLDSLLLVFFLGVLVAYVAALINFLEDTPLRVLGPMGNASVAGLIMTGLSLVPDLGYLSRASAAGLAVLIGSFAVIAVCGLVSFQERQGSAPQLNWRPESLVGMSHWFGIVVLGYGVVPLTYNFRESMAEPHRLVSATGWALGGVAVWNAIIGVGLYALFPNVQDEILHELGTGFVPVLTRFAMVVVVLLTTPLLIVPCSEMLEGKLGIESADFSSTRFRDLVRLAIVATAAGLAVWVPSFVMVFALVGCFCGGLLGLCLPPLLYLRLVKPQAYFADLFLLAAGTVTTFASTLYSIGKLQTQAI